MGASLMLGSVVEWLTPIPKKAKDGVHAESWTINGGVNNVTQGDPVPVIYGEVLTEGYPISAGILASKVAVSEGAAAAVAIGGNTSPAFMTGGGGTYTAVVTLSASPRNVGSVQSYAWTVTGFTEAVAKRVLQTTTATVRIELDFTLSANQINSSAGTVSLSVVAAKSYDTYDMNDTATVTASVPVTVVMNSSTYAAP